jgi:hypothetical protein
MPIPGLSWTSCSRDNVKAPPATDETIREPREYDAVCTEARLKTKARGVILVVFSADKGSGFSCQADMEITGALPEILEISPSKSARAEFNHENKTTTTVYKTNGNHPHFIDA